jgi:hypothetical protein
MKRFVIAAVAVTVALLSTVSGASAQGYGSRGEGRFSGQRNLQEVESRRVQEILRIERGRSEGLLSERESRYLNSKMARIGAMEQRAFADGRIDRGEAERLHYELDKVHDDVTRLISNNEGSRRRNGGGGYLR